MSHRPSQSSTAVFANRWMEAEREAIAAGPMAPGEVGQVRYRASWWLARSLDAPIAAGELVCVLGRQDTTLLVAPLVATPSLP